MINDDVFHSSQELNIILCVVDNYMAKTLSLKIILFKKREKFL